MGADLYINSIHQPNYDRVKPLFDAACAIRNKLDRTLQPEQYDAAQADVDRYFDEMDSIGYFRDSYNPTGIMSKLGLSWWQDVGNMLDDESDLQPEKTKELLQSITERKPQLDAYLETADFSEWGEPREEVVTYFQEKYTRFTTFLQQAIDLNQPIHCSI